ncbi:TonB-dependent siderophore receptor [Aurantiacibacter xanthus]|uniref:TonB-dependent siderophore receptor n=1 Tax=Aurantiacibacter xanthus TaxID=1784712 RepID=A0A3A1P4X6_9SPHN|nr:TonB-dependent siderophore receptor [Aurantiacibacter xanthus]RIV88166.1 TonB-dependent siderophore receptor [Aurantiacibacter xanthus]
MRRQWGGIERAVRGHLSKLLAGGVLMTMPSVVYAESAQDASVGAEADTTDADIVVLGRAQNYYRVRETMIGKVPADPLNIPQTVTIVNAELIEDQGARQITELYRNVAGVSNFSYAGVTFRGFRQIGGAYYDGLRGDVFSGFSAPQLFNVERVEFLKGPAGMLYGPGAPGGTINYVTKKPSETFSANLRGIVGNYDRYGASGDITGSLTSDGGIAGRASLFYEHYDEFRDHAESKTFVADGGLTFKLGERSKLTAQATYYDQDLPGALLRGIPTDMAGNFLASINWNHNEPTDFVKLNAQVYQAQLETELSDAISANVSSRWFQYNEHQNYHQTGAPYDSDGDNVVDKVIRQYRDNTMDITGLSFAGNLVGRAELAGMAHTILIGGDWNRQTTDYEDLRINPEELGGPVPGLSLRNPVYGLTGPADYGRASLSYDLSSVRGTRYGLYAQDQIVIADRFILVGGVRHDWFKDSNYPGNEAASGDATTWRAGAIYKPRPDISVYVNWSDTFEPQSAGNQRAIVGGPFAPVTGAQIEGGVKTALLDGKIQTDFAVYQIVRENVLQVDTSLPQVSGEDQLAPLGEVTSKGFEFSISADITPDWVALANYGYNDTKITGTAPGQSISNAVGNRFVNAPRHQAGFWTRYNVRAIDTSFAFGGQYVSEQLGFDGERVKPFTVFDGSITKKLAFVDIMLRVENIFDKYYAVSGFGLANGAFPGRPRTAFVEVRRYF